MLLRTRRRPVATKTHLRLRTLHPTTTTTADTNPVNSTEDQNNSQEENKAPTNQVSANLFNTGPNTGSARATKSITTKTTSAVFMSVLLWWI